MASAVKVIAGITCKNGANNNNTFNVSQIILHPTLDVALLKLSSNIPYNNSRRAINYLAAIDIACYNVGNAVRVPGWGWQTPNGYNPADCLNAVNVHIISNQNAAIALGSTVHDYEVATTGIGAVRQGACHGDSGGPLVFWSNTLNEYVLVGVVSWGVPGCTGNNSTSPSVFVRVSHLINWILETTKPISITGPDYVCSNATSTFTVNNLPSNISVSWTVSPDLQIVGSTANSASVQKKSFSSTNSDNWVQATVLNYPVRKNITVWQSGIQDYMVNQAAMQGYAYCTGGNFSVYYPAGRSLGGSNFTWSSSCDWTPSYQGYFTTDFSGNDCGTASVYITVNFTDVCGSSSTIYKNFDIDCYTSYSAAYPNPASTELTIDKIEETDNNIEIQSNIKAEKPPTVKVLLYSHATTKLVFSKDYSSEEKQIKIDTSKLPDGVYYLNIIENGETIKEQTVIINH